MRVPRYTCSARDRHNYSAAVALTIYLLELNTNIIKKKTLKDILQEEKILKVLFDIRNDSDALFAYFGVELITAPAVCVRT